MFWGVLTDITTGSVSLTPAAIGPKLFLMQRPLWGDKIIFSPSAVKLAPSAGRHTDDDVVNFPCLG